MGEDGESMSGRTNYCYFTKQKISTKQKETTYTNKNKSHTHTMLFLYQLTSGVLSFSFCMRNSLYSFADCKGARYDVYAEGILMPSSAAI